MKYLSGVLVQSLVGWVVGFFSAVLAEPVRQGLFGPKLKLEFGNGQEFKTRTPEDATFREVTWVTSHHEAFYIRIKATNERRAIAKGCRAFLVAIEKMDEDSAFKPTIYCDSIPLTLSCQDEDQRYTPLDLPNGVSQFVDVVSTRNLSGMSPCFRPEIQVTPQRYVDLFQEHGTFRFTVQVSGENVKPVSIRVAFRWQGIWDDCTAYSG
jgi:hypothetical protein